MSILIKGMEMPKDGFVEIIIKADGTVQQTGQTLRLAGDYFYTAYVGERPPMYKAVPVPPHGRLIEADPIIQFITDGLNSGEFGYDQIKVMAEVQYAPTIISEEQSGKEV